MRMAIRSPLLFTLSAFLIPIWLKNLAREKQFLAQVKEWKGYTVKSLGVGDGVTMVESAMDFINQQNQPVHMEQVAVQQWKDGKIVHERFYYDSGAK